MRIAVLICTYGGKDWAELAWSRAYPSAIDQGPGWEVIVRHDVDGGLADCRNRAAANAQAEWLCFLDADDELGLGYLREMHAGLLAAYPDSSQGTVAADGTVITALLAPAVEYHHPSGVIEQPRLPNRHQPMNVMNHCVIGTLVPRWLFMQVGGFRRDLHDCLLEDYDLWLRCIRAGAVVVDVPAAVYKAHERASASRRTQHCYEAIVAEHNAWLEQQAQPAI